MNEKASSPPERIWQYAGENLRRLKSSGIYYAFAKHGGKQISRSLKTADKATATRLRNDFLNDLAALSSDDAAKLTFDQIAARRTEADKFTLKASTITRRALCVKILTPFFFGLQIRHITAQHCEAWLLARRDKVSARTITIELETMRGVFRYAIEQGLILRDPSRGIKRPRVKHNPPEVPTRDQFTSIIASIRGESQHRGKAGAELVELLAYSGMRLDEARSLRWRDVNFTGGVFTVTGGERGTKNHLHRTVPLSDEMRRLLEQMKQTRGEVEPDSPIIQTASAKKCLATACQNLKLPGFHHHSMRHYFATCAIESGVDVPTVARWLGHRDGGALLMKTYAHLQQEHSREQMKRVSFASKQIDGATN